MVGRFDGYRGEGIEIAFGSRKRKRRPIHLYPLNGGNFTGHTQHAQTIWTIGCQTDLQREIVQVESILQGITRLQGRIQDQQAGSVHTQFQLDSAAQHTLGRFTADHCFLKHHSVG